MCVLWASVCVYVYSCTYLCHTGRSCYQEEEDNRVSIKSTGNRLPSVHLLLAKPRSCAPCCRSHFQTTNEQIGQEVTDSMGKDLRVQKRRNSCRLRGCRGRRRWGLGARVRKVAYGTHLPTKERPHMKRWGEHSSPGLKGKKRQQNGTKKYIWNSTHSKFQRRAGLHLIVHFSKHLLHK